MGKEVVYHQLFCFFRSTLPQGLVHWNFVCQVCAQGDKVIYIASRAGPLELRLSGAHKVTQKKVTGFKFIHINLNKYIFMKL